MKEWWDGLNTREQRIVLFGGIAVAVMVLYFGVWESVQNRRAALEKAVVEKRAERDWMQQAVEEVKIIEGNGGTGRKPPPGGASLLATVEQTIKRAKLGPALRRVEPEGNSAARVWLDGASFDDTMRWLAKLQQDNGVYVSSITVDRQDAPGIVNVRLSLQGSGS